MLFFFVSSGHLDDVVEENGKEQDADKAVASSDPIFVGAGDGGVEEKEN